jgi:hypothetical protein
MSTLTLEFALKFPILAAVPVAHPRLCEPNNQGVVIAFRTQRPDKGEWPL